MHLETIAHPAGSVTARARVVAPASDGPPRPAVLVAHAWRGQGDFERAIAARLADLGYVGIAADVYGDGVIAADNAEAEALMTPLASDRIELRARIGAAIETARAHPLVDDARIAAVGYCFGGMTVLEIARGGLDVRGVVSFHGLFHTGEAPTVSNPPAKVLMCHGYDDAFAPPEQIDAIAAEFTTAGVDWQMHVYGHAVHAFTNPEANDPEFGVRYDPDADRRSWLAMRHFLDEVLA